MPGVLDRTLAEEFKVIYLPVVVGSILFTGTKYYTKRGRGESLCTKMGVSHLFKEQHFLILDLVRKNLSGPSRLLSKKNFMEPTRPKAKKLGAQHVK